MHVGVLTYQIGHLKTWQILKRLIARSFRITVYAFPFFARQIEKRHFEDRPYQLIDLDIEGFCKRSAIGYVKVGGWSDRYSGCLGTKNAAEETPDAYLTCIAKIIPQSFISGRIIINAHPGLLPENRGVDAFKWAVVNGWPIGVSLHAIDEAIDRGILLHRAKVPVLPTDRLRDVADRAYEMECDLQASFDSYLSALKGGARVTDKYPLSKIRVPEEIDAQMENIFQRQKEKLISLSGEKKALRPCQTD